MQVPLNQTDWPEREKQADINIHQKGRQAGKEGQTYEQTGIQTGTLTFYTLSMARAVVGTDGVDNRRQIGKAVCVGYPVADVKFHSDQTLLFDVFYGHQYPALVACHL